MRNYSLIIGLICISINLELAAQQPVIKLSPIKRNEHTQTNYNYCGFNTNLLLSKFIPYNYKNIVALNSSILYRNYNSNNRGFRLGFGLNTGNYGFANTNLLTFAIEYDKRKAIRSRWYIFHGYGLHNGYAGPVFSRSRQTSKDNEIFLAVSYHFGAEFIVNEVLSLSTECKIWTGIIFKEGEEISNFDPPINFMAHFNLSTKN